MRYLAAVAVIVALGMIPAWAQHGGGHGGGFGAGHGAGHGSFGGHIAGPSHGAFGGFGAGRIGSFPSHGLRPPAFPSHGFHSPRTPGFAGGYRSGYGRDWHGYRDHFRHRTPYWPGFRGGYIYNYSILPGWGYPYDYGFEDDDSDATANTAPPPSDMYNAPPPDTGPYNYGPEEPYPPQQAYEAPRPSTARPAYVPQQQPVTVQPLAPLRENTVTVIFNNGRAPEKIHNYMLTAKTLTILDGHTQEIPLSQVDIAATEKANAAAGVDFQVPEAE